jgi:hypothetical protein
MPLTESSPETGEKPPIALIGDVIACYLTSRG